MDLWHTKTLPKVFEALNSNESGLSSSEAKKRLAEHGPNTLPEPKVPSIATIFLSQFLSPLIYLLIAAAALVLFMGETADAVIIVFVLIFNAIVGTVQEGKARQTMRALRQFVSTSAAVMRDGKITILADKEIVPGDVFIVQEGDKIPTDARLISANALKINEASLTGESVPAGKNIGVLKSASLLPQDRKNMVFKGTNVASGNGMALAVATGISTEIGKLSQVMATMDTEIPLKKNIRLLSRLIIGIVFAIGGAFMIFGFLADIPVRQLFATVVSLSVSIIPEGLPIVMTLVLATGVWRMAKRNVLVKKLQAVEALGQARIIAVDKTGTLTKNEMVVQSVYAGGTLFNIEGRGYEATGNVLLNDMVIEPANHPDLMLAGRVAAFCSNAHAMYVESSKMWKVSGDPTEAALAVFGQKIGFKAEDPESLKIFDIPFDYATKYHITIHTLQGRNFLTAVGAPESILEKATRMWRSGKSERLTKKKQEEIEKVLSELSRKGLRVLAFAFNQNAGTSVPKGKLPVLTFGGFYGMKDPLRQEVRLALQEASEAGIRVVMITGDHRITAHAIAKEAGLTKDGDEVITGEELENLSDAELMGRFAHCNVFARVTPEHKLRIIELFRKRGEIVAMTGDGVNDAPSLAAADLGVAMGKIGTEVTKEAADLVLLDDNFGSIIAAVEEGRSIYRTIKKVILYLFSTGIGEVLTLVGAMAFGFPLPLLPAQIIWLNFVTDGFLDVALAMEPKEAGLLTQSFKKPSPYILDRASLWRMLFMGVIIAAGSLILFSRYLDGNFEKALTMSVTVLAAFQWFNAWNCKSEDKSLFMTNPFKNKFLIASTFIVVCLQVFAVYNPFMQRFLHTTALSGGEWAIAVSWAASIVVLEELRKFFVRR